jgi:hypothetical protein
MDWTSSCEWKSMLIGVVGWPSLNIRVTWMVSVYRSAIRGWIVSVLHSREIRFTITEYEGEIRRGKITWNDKLPIKSGHELFLNSS